LLDSSDGKPWIAIDGLRKKNKTAGVEEVMRQIIWR